MGAPLNINDLAASSIHEIKNLLGQLTLSLEEIAQDAKPGTEQKIASARFACSRVVDQLTEILTLYKLESGHLQPSVDAHSPADFLEDLQLSARHLTGGRVQITLQANPEAPAFWFFDRELAQGALMNALHNALAHARSKITLRIDNKEEYLVLTIADDGPGYPPTLLDSPLTQPQTTHQGGGLGLFFANSVAKAHENKGRCGKVMLHNAAEGGAVFCLYLP